MDRKETKLYHSDPMQKHHSVSIIAGLNKLLSLLSKPRPSPKKEEEGMGF
jgi:hypothetical protein